MASRKSPDAFRTISEVSEWLDTPAHVLRFWESRFSQVKPVKRAGGRRYYRPSDMLLLGGLKKLLHEDGMTIRGVQKLLREKGVKHVSALSMPLEPETPQAVADAPPEAAPVEMTPPAPVQEPPETAREEDDQGVLVLEGGTLSEPAAAAPAEPSPEKPTQPKPETAAQLDLIPDGTSVGASKISPAVFRARLRNPENRATLRQNPVALQKAAERLRTLHDRMAAS